MIFANILESIGDENRSSIQLDRADLGIDTVCDDSILLSDIDLDEIDNSSSDNEEYDPDEPPSKKKCVKADATPLEKWCQKWEKESGHVKNDYCNRNGSDVKKPYKLSAKLAELVGAKRLPRHVVVKKIFSFIKDNNLYDGNNKNYAICNKQLFDVIGVKRVKIFDIVKYLQKHFIKD